MADARCLRLAHARVRTQLEHAAPASQFLTVFASSGAVFQTNDRFEHIPFLTYAMGAHFSIGVDTFFCPGSKPKGLHATSANHPMNPIHLSLKKTETVS